MRQYIAALLAVLLLAGCMVQQEPNTHEEPTHEEPEPEVVYTDEHTYQLACTIPIEEWYPVAVQRVSYQYHSADDAANVLYTNLELATPTDFPYSPDREDSDATARELYDQASIFKPLIQFIDVGQKNVIEWQAPDPDGSFAAYDVMLLWDAALCRHELTITASSATPEDSYAFIELVSGLKLDREVCDKVWEDAGSEYTIHVYVTDTIILQFGDGRLALTWFKPDYNAMQFDLSTTNDLDAMYVESANGQGVVIDNASWAAGEYTYKYPGEPDGIVKWMDPNDVYDKTYDELYDYLQVTGVNSSATFTAMVAADKSQFTWYSAAVDYAVICQTLYDAYAMVVPVEVMQEAATYAYNNKVPVTFLNGDWRLSVSVELLYDYPVLNVYASYGYN